LIALLLAALLTVRGGGAHLHLCFDGSEPPSSLHFEDAGHHEEHHVDQVHDDLDLDLVSDAATKFGKLSLDLYLLLFAGLFFLLPRMGFLLRRGPEPPVRASDPLLLLPPPRGPPALISP
jgi:hypothetical protein